MKKLVIDGTEMREPAEVKEQKKGEAKAKAKQPANKAGKAGTK